MKKILLLLPIFVIISCSTQKNHFSIEYFRKSSEINKIIKKLNTSNKETSEKQIFGKNEIILRSFTDKEGNITAEYSFTRQKNNFSSYLPIISFFMPREYINYEAIVTFNNKSQKVSTIDFFNEVSMSSRLFCNPPSFSCIDAIR